MATWYDNDFANDALQVRISELLVATADGADELVSAAVTEVLRLLRERLRMDVVFVAEFVDGQRIFRRVEAELPHPAVFEGGGGPLELSYCQRVVDGRLPPLVGNTAALAGVPGLPVPDFPLGAYLSTPIVLTDGRVYGTLCCFSASPNEDLQQRDLKHLQLTAQLAARNIERQGHL